MMTGNVDIKGIVFDKDGVLVDFEETWTQVLLDMAKELAEGDTVLETKLRVLAGYSSHIRGFEAGSIWAAGNTGELVDSWVEHLKGFSPSQLYDYIDVTCMNVSAVPLHGIAPLQKLFVELKQLGLSLGITTNDIEASAVKTMDEFGLSPYLSLICGFDSVENPKPAADPVFAFCDISGLKPEQVLVIGDNLHDLEMAKNSKVGLAVGVLTGNSTRAELEPLADYILETVLGLPELLQQLNLKS